MSRAHFAYIARILREVDCNNLNFDWVVQQFATHLADTNPRFQKDRFIAAAKGEC